MTIPALIYLAAISVFRGNIYFMQFSITTNILLILSGIATIVPLLLYVYGIRRIRISLAGLLQYISPTCIFLMGVFVFKEKFTDVNLIAFILICTGLVVLSWKNIRNLKLRLN